MNEVKPQSFNSNIRAGLRQFLERPAFFLAAALTCLLTNGLFCYYAIKSSGAM